MRRLIVIAAAVLGLLAVAHPAAGAPAKSGTVSVSVAPGSVVVSGSWSRSVKDPRLGVQCYRDGVEVYGMFFGPESDPWWTSTGRLSGSAFFDLSWGREPVAGASCVAWLKDYVGAPWTREIVTVAEVPFSPEA